MSTAAMHLEPVFFWLLHATAKVSALVCLVLLLQWALGQRLGVQGCCRLWLILLAFLTLFYTQHRSLYIDGPCAWQATKAYVSSLVPRANGTDSPSEAEENAASEKRNRQRAEEVMAGKDMPWPAARGLSAPAVRILALIWLGGAVAFALYITFVHLHFRRVLAAARPLTDRTLLTLLDDCRRLMEVRHEVHLLLTDAIGAPSLCGHARPCLLLSRELMAGSDLSELRHIFLHELAHLKRRDILLGHLATLLHILQWFNPLVAWAFRRMRDDRELACDALALSVMERDETRAYGHTVVRQLERLRGARRVPILAALIGDKTRVKQRIALIAAFDRTKYRGSPLTVAFAMSLVCLALWVPFAGSQALGGAMEAAIVPWDVRARRDVPTTHSDQHANIQRACIRNRMTEKFLVVEADRIACNADEPGDAGLWEIRFDAVSNTAESAMYLYSVPARKYLVCDEQGNLALDAREPAPSAAWGTYPRPQGVWLISQYAKDGYLRLTDQGAVRAVHFGRDEFSYWDVHAVWRIKTSNDPASNPTWQREHIPGPD